MTTKNKQILKEKSSKKVATFLEKSGLHKKDFAEMIGVTLSYVYNLIDNTIPFSTRGTTLERIATIMEIALIALIGYLTTKIVKVNLKFSQVGIMSIYAVTLSVLL